MFKVLSTFSLPKGTDPDEFWKYHTEVHARDFVKVAGPRLKKYTISRVKGVRVGKPNFFGVTETWFENEEVEKQVMGEVSKTILPNGKNIFEDFHSRVVNTSMVAVVVEEKVIV